MIRTFFLTKTDPADECVLLLFLGDMHSSLSLSVYGIKVKPMILIVEVKRKIG